MAKPIRIFAPLSDGGTVGLNIDVVVTDPGSGHFVFVNLTGRKSTKGGCWIQRETFRKLRAIARSTKRRVAL